MSHHNEFIVMFEIFAILKGIPPKSLFTHLCPLAQFGSNCAGRKTEWNWNTFSDINSYWPQDKKKTLCNMNDQKNVFFSVKHPKVHCGCPGGFRVQRKAEGNSPHQLFNCRGSDMVWFIGNFVSLFISSFCCNSTSLLKPIFEAWFKFCSQEGPNLNQWSLPEGSKTHLYFRFIVCNHIFWNFLPFIKHYLKTWKKSKFYFIHGGMIHVCLDYTLMEYSHLDYLWC